MLCWSRTSLRYHTASEYEKFVQLTLSFFSLLFLQATQTVVRASERWAASLRASMKASVKRNWKESLERISRWLSVCTRVLVWSRRSSLTQISRIMSATETTLERHQLPLVPPDYWCSRPNDDDVGWVDLNRRKVWWYIFHFPIIIINFNGKLARGRNRSSSQDLV